MTTPNEALREALKPFAEIDLATFAELVLHARVALSQPMPEAAPQGWIPVEQKMPEPDSGEVLVWLKSGQCAFDEWHVHGEDPTGLGGATMEMGLMWRDYEFEDITHWMPLPDAPDSASPAAPVTEKPEHAGERVEPEVVWLAKDHAGQLFIVLGDGPHDVYGGEKYITLQYHHEVMAEETRLHEMSLREYRMQCMANAQKIQRKNAALVACVEALKTAWSSTYVNGVEARKQSNAAITQAQEALK